MDLHDRLAVNPLPRHDPSLDRCATVFAQAFADLHDIGLAAVTADVPDDVDPADYLHWIGLYDLRPSPGVLVLDVTAEPEAALETALRFADHQLLLGQDRAMITTADRLPAARSEHGPARLDLLAERVGAVVALLRFAGLHPMVRPRLGSAVESLAETTHLLDGAADLGLAIDTAHLAAAAPDPAAVVRHYADRVGAVVLSDLDAADAVLPALPAGYDGDFVLEVGASGVDFYRAHLEAYEQAQRLLEGTRRRAASPAYV